MANPFSGCAMSDLDVFDLAIMKLALSNTRPISSAELGERFIALSETHDAWLNDICPRRQATPEAEGERWVIHRQTKAKLQRTMGADIWPFPGPAFYETAALRNILKACYDGATALSKAVTGLSAVACDTRQDFRTTGRRGARS